MHVGAILAKLSSKSLEVYASLSYFGVVMSYIYGMLFNNESLSVSKVLGTISQKYNINVFE